MKRRRGDLKSASVPGTAAGPVYKMILDNLNDGVYFIDKARKITYWNKAAEDLTGYRSSEVLGRLCTHDVVCHLSKKGAPICLKPLCPLNTVFKKKKVHEEGLYVRHKDGQRVYIQSRIIPLQDEKGEIMGAVAVLTENTREAAETKKNVFSLTVVSLLNRYFDSMPESLLSSESAAFKASKNSSPSSILEAVQKRMRETFPFDEDFAALLSELGIGTFEERW